MRYYLTAICLLTGFISYCQEDNSDKKVHFGLNISTVFSLKLGISPALSLDFAQHYISVGPRITFDRMKGDNKKWKDEMIFDLNYRFYPFKKLERIKPFAQFTSEYMYSYNKYEEYYIANSEQFSPQYQFEFVFPYSFNLRHEWIRHHLNLYIGAGADIVIWKNLYANISGGFGWMFRSSKLTYTNITTGNVEHETTEDLKEPGGSWMASFGIGYRF